MSVELDKLLGPEYAAKRAAWEAREVVFRPRRVAVAKTWQPLLQAMQDAGVSSMIEQMTNTTMPRLEIGVRPFPLLPNFARYSPPYKDFAEGQEDVNVFSSVSPTYRDPMSTEWRLRVLLFPQEGDEFDSTLRLEAVRIPRWESSEPHVYRGNQNFVSFEIDQDRNLRIRGQKRVRVALNRAFGHPAVDATPIAFVTL